MGQSGLHYSEMDNMNQFVWLYNYFMINIYYIGCLWEDLKGSVHPNYKKTLSHLARVVSSHADSLGFICAGFEIPVSTLVQWRQMEFHLYWKMTLKSFKSNISNKLYTATLVKRDKSGNTSGLSILSRDLNGLGSSTLARGSMDLHWWTILTYFGIVHI